MASILEERGEEEWKGMGSWRGGEGGMVNIKAGNENVQVDVYFTFLLLVQF